MRILENEKKMKALGITNIAKSLKSKPESQKTQQTKVKPHFIPPMYMNRVVNQVKLRQPAGSNVPHKIPLSKDNKGEKRKLVLVDEDDDEDDESFQVDHDIQDDESQEISDALQRNNQYEIEMVKCSKSKNKGICKRKRLQMVTTSTVFDERITDPVHDDLVEENQVYETQVHQTGDIQDAPKKVRGYTKKAQTWKMDSTQRIVVRFNKFGKPVGDEANELAQFLGSLVRISDHVSIEYPDWRKVPTQNKEDMYSLVKSKFVFLPNETNEIKKWILYSMGKKWRSWKGSLKARLYDPSLTVDEIVGQQVKNDKRVCQTQFKELATRWFTPKFQSTCKAKRMSRSKMKEPHVSGTKSFARLAHEMAMKNDGVYPTRGEMYIKTRTRKDGTIVDDEASHVVAALKDITNDSTKTSDDQNDITNDAYSKVKGPEKRGYIRLVGKMSTEKNNVPSEESETINKLKSAVNALAMIIQDHIPNANLTPVLSNLNVEVPGIGSSPHNNSLSVNQISSSKSQNDNGKERRLGD